MNREEAFDVMKLGGYVTHPVLKEANIGPLFSNENVIYDKNNGAISTAWRTKIDSKYFNDGWITCNENGDLIKE